MVGKDEIIFSGKYKGLDLNVRYGLDGKSGKDVAAVLNHLSSKIEPLAFSLSGINMEGIDKFADPQGKGLEAVCRFLDQKSSEWSKWIKGPEGNLGNPKLLAAADSCLFNRLFAKAGVGFKAEESLSIQPEKEDASDVIAFIGKYKDWMAIKKLSLENVKDYEVSGTLSSINYTLVNKGFDFSDIEKNDAAVDAALQGKRKSYGNASESLKALEPKLKGDKSDAYLVCKVLEKVGYRPYASPHMLTDAYPDIKPPKVKGRKPKG